MLEFNELCPGLLSDFMDEGKLPNFRRLYESSTVFTTDADELAPHLEPWIQWATIHSGLSYDVHQAFHLNDGRTIKQKFVAELLSDAGIRVGVFGSMNSNYTKLNGYYVPDPWDANASPQPAWLEPFYRTVAHQVQNSSNGGGIPKRDLARFGMFMALHGMRPGTGLNVVRQLISEKRLGGVAWRRASLLEEMQYDLFRYLDRRFEPQFATFFCNSTAHYQHYYWRNMHPDIFDIPPDADDHPSLRTAIEYGYIQMDGLIERFLSDFPDVVLILCTALSQQPWTETTKCTFRPRDFGRLMKFAGISDEVRIKPVMAEQFHIEFADNERAREAAERIAALKLDDMPLMTWELNEPSIFTGCAVNDALAMRREVTSPTGQTVPFRELFHMVHSMRSGRHHPDGVLWVRTGNHRVERNKVALTDLAPTILNWFNIPSPAYMGGRPLELTPTSTGSQLLAV